MRKSKYGVSPKAVAAAVVSMGLECSERAAQGALKMYAEEKTTFSSVRAAAEMIADYKREHGCFPRVSHNNDPLEMVHLFTKRHHARFRNSLEAARKEWQKIVRRDLDDIVSELLYGTPEEQSHARLALEMSGLFCRK